MVLSRDDINDKAKERHRSLFEELESEIDSSLGRYDPDDLNEYSPVRIEYKGYMPEFVRQWLRDEYGEGGWVISILFIQGAPDYEWTIQIY